MRRLGSRNTTNSSLLLPKKVSEREPFLIRAVKSFYVPVLKYTMPHKAAVLLFGATVLAVAFGVVAPPARQVALTANRAGTRGTEATTAGS